MVSQSRPHLQSKGSLGRFLLVRTRSCHRLASVTFLFLRLQLNWATIAHFLKSHFHFPFRLEGLLQFAKQLSLLKFKFLWILLCLIRVILFVCDSLVVILSQVILVEVAHRVVKRLSANLIIFDVLELPLVVFHVVVDIKTDHMIDFVLLILEVQVGVSVCLESALQTSLNAGLRLHTVFIEFSPVSLLGIFAIIPHVLQALLPLWFFIVHIRNKFLPPLQVLDPLVGSLFLFFKFDDSILNLSFLVLLLFSLNNCAHHNVFCFLAGDDRAHAGCQTFVRLLDWVCLSCLHNIFSNKFIKIYSYI